MNQPLAKQDRSRRTQKALLDALDTLLKERAFEAIGVVDIAREASLSPASIYRRFGKKDGLLPALYQLQIERVTEWNEQAWVKERLSELTLGETPLRDVLECHVELAVHQLSDLRHLARPMALYGRMKPHLFGEEADSMPGHAHAGVRALLNHYADEIRHPDMDLATAMIAYHMQTALNDFVLFRDRTVLPGTNLSKKDFAHQIARFLYGYLTVAGDQGPALAKPA